MAITRAPSDEGELPAPSRGRPGPPTDPLREPVREPEPVPEPVREPVLLPDVLPERVPDLLRGPLPEPEPVPDPLREPEPEPLRESEPDPLREPEPDPLRESAPDLLRDPVPVPVPEQGPLPLPDGLRDPLPESSGESERPAAASRAPARKPPETGRLTSPLALTLTLLLLVLLQGPIRRALAAPVMQSWTTVFLAVVVQALPFLVLGVLLSAAIAVYVPPSFFARALPRRPALAVPVAGAAGAVLPGCECASVPVAGALVRRGVTPAAALAFLLSAPAINPIVLTATAVAFPHAPEMVLARFAASLLVACAMGWLWHRLGRTDWLRPPSHAPHEGRSRGEAFWGSVRHDVMHAGGFLVVGAMAAATLKAAVPETWLRTAAGHPAVAVLALAVLAVVLSLCSEADAFVAASLTQFSLTARLTFLVVGPMIDLKLFAMQAGTFGRAFALRFAPATFVLAVAVSALTGAVLL